MVGEQRRSGENKNHWRISHTSQKTFSHRDHKAIVSPQAQFIKNFAIIPIWKFKNISDLKIVYCCAREKEISFTDLTCASTGFSVGRKHNSINCKRDTYNFGQKFSYWFQLRVIVSACRYSCSYCFTIEKLGFVFIHLMC